MNRLNKRIYFLPGVDRRKIRLSEEAKYSVTHWRDGQLINTYMLRLLQSKKRFSKLENESMLQYVSIIDGTACVGGNTVMFCKDFNHVVAIEINSEHVKMLRHNVNLYYNFKKKVKIHRNNVITFYPKVVAKNKYNIMFLDPPWGGPEYKSEKRIELFLGDTPVTDLCIKMLQTGVQMVVLKAPFNYDTAVLEKRCREKLGKKKFDFQIQKLHKYNCIYIHL